MKDMLKLGIVLALYATAACVGLAFVYSGTEKVIAERQAADLNAALQELFPQADSFTDITGDLTSPNPLVAFESQYEARQNNAIIGVAVRASTGSYGGPIKVLVGVGVDNKLSRIKVLEHQDTPGLGANAGSPTYYVDKPNKLTFYGQFEGKSITDAFEPQADVVAITAATITSRAVSSVAKASGSAAAAWLAVHK
ncbi:MAG: FMN-binding protein [Treponema sp.]|jgi:electron transport complex protein RnfG|nr:FMN-binding protein [Treponema sp.]